MATLVEVPGAETAAVVVNDMKILASYLQQMEERLVQLSPASLAPAIAADANGRNALQQLRTVNDRLRHVLWIVQKNIDPSATR